jgi:hypothetical protein
VLLAVVASNVGCRIYLEVVVWVTTANNCLLWSGEEVTASLRYFVENNRKNKYCNKK